MKTLIIKFGAAKLPRTPWFDRKHAMIIGSETNVKRCSSPAFWNECPPETLLTTTVSNVLHVLAGDRPVPTIRKDDGPWAPTVRKDLYDLAAAAHVEITTGIAPSEKDPSVMEYVPKFGEILMTRKSSAGSTDPATFAIEASSTKARRFCTWERFREQHPIQKYEDSYDTVVATVGSILGLSAAEVEEKPLLVAFQEARAVNLDTLKKVIDVVNIRSPWKVIALTGVLPDAKSLRTGYGDKESIYRMTISRGCEKFSHRDGYIYVPLADGQEDLFINGPGFATILDGGLAVIEGVEDALEEHYGHVPTFKHEEVTP